ncbi:hypothetical protein F750_4045 [Streptomyces sp. PAMC 26508]|nr:hypothetical protein F750_4045 [Streptomyces sp. PAMC 26508]
MSTTARRGGAAAASGGAGRGRDGLRGLRGRLLRSGLRLHRGTRPRRLRRARHPEQLRALQPADEPRHRRTRPRRPRHARGPPAALPEGPGLDPPPLGLAPGRRLVQARHVRGRRRGPVRHRLPGATLLGYGPRGLRSGTCGPGGRGLLRTLRRALA